MSNITHITPAEAIMALAVNIDGIDATNIIERTRDAKQRLVARLLPNTSPAGWIQWLNEPQNIDYIDDMIIRATYNGRDSLFA